MRILVIGASGAMGTNVVKGLSTHHGKFGEGVIEILKASTTSTDYPMDCTDDSSVRELFEKVGCVDAVVSTIGGAQWASAEVVSLEQIKATLEGKLLCQLRIALAARDHVVDGGSITLTSGIVGNFAFHGGSPSSIANLGLDAFVRNAAQELRRIRLNAVSATVLEESADAYGTVFPGFLPISGERVASAYVRSVYGTETGQTIKVWS
ncbi:short chain dehydrogenase [Specibacter sp. NPDC078692]|uniref:short chain dehydrogenase n=1 Tax=Specibacter sp. NPDC078692 TaxID=3155818 RepID=UPI00341F52CA